MKKEYLSPKIAATYVFCDVITYSETEEWEGPMIEAANDENNA